MADNIHPAAQHHLPPFLPASDGSDAMMVVMAVFLVAVVFLVGVFYLRLHSLPERRMHGAGKVQFEIVAVLALISLFTHNHLFWIAALLIALIRMPDFLSPVRSMAESLDRLARQGGDGGGASLGQREAPDEAGAEVAPVTKGGPADA